MAESGAAALVAVASAYLLTHQGVRWAAAFLVAPAVFIWITRRQGNGLLLAVLVILVVPYWYPHVWLIAPSLAALGLVAGVARPRLRAVDFAFFLLVGTFALSWLLHPELRIPAKSFAQGLLPLGFYIFARLTITESFLPRLQLLMCVAGGFAACTVLYEAARGTAVFVDPQTYQWSGTASAIFRAGGVFGGSPSAATILALVCLSSVSTYRGHRLLAATAMTLMFAATVVTFDRAGFAAFVVGTVVFALLLPYTHWVRVAMVALAVSIPVVAVASSSSTLAALTTTRLVSEGVLRPATISGRVSLASGAFQVMADSPSHLLFGRGFDALEATAGEHDLSMAVQPQLWEVQHGPNDDYLRAILEQGILGLVLTLAWLGGAVLLGVRSCLRLPPRSHARVVLAGLTCATAGYLVAAAGHDFTHNVADLSVAALMTGMLVTASTMSREGELS